MAPIGEGNKVSGRSDECILEIDATEWRRVDWLLITYCT